MNKELPVEDYVKLAVICNFLIEHDQYDLGAILNRNGKCAWTVCPECQVDDFVHVEGCKIGERINEKCQP